MSRWYVYFLFYSFAGYVLEKLFARAIHSDRQVRKCFLLLPLCPVYGLAMTAVLALALWKGLFKHPLGKLTLTLLLAGAVGNLIDRAFRGFVVDMFNVLFMNFAVFNVADICVVVGGISAGLYYLLLMDKLEPREEAPHEQADADR